MRRLVIVLIFCSFALLYAQSEGGASIVEVSPTPSAASPDPSQEPAGTPEPSPSPTVSDAGSAAAGTSVSSLDTLDLRNLDFGEASISLAGPSAVYIRGIKVGSSKLSLLFKKNDQDLWVLAETSPEENNVFPANSIFDFAKLSLLADGSLEIDGILLDGKPFKTIALIEGNSNLRIRPSLEAGALVGLSLQRSKKAGELAYVEEIKENENLKTAIDEKERLNQESLAKIGDLSSAREKLAEENTRLETELQTLQERNGSLVSEVQTLKEEVAALKQNVEAAASGSSGDSSGQSGAKDYDALLRQIMSSIDVLGNKVDDLGKKISETGGGVSTSGNDTTTSTASAGSEADREEIKRLAAEIEKLMAERQGLEVKIRETFVNSGYLATLKPTLTKTALSGFDGAKAKIGAWKVGRAEAEQSDAGQYFAQLDLPLKQNEQTMLYRFKARSLGKDWVGLGLHIYSSGSEKRGYGHGKSILVWFTRDPEYYKNKATHLHLYRSDDDINMGRVLDATLQESVDQDLLVEVLYQPKDEYITVAVNGIEKIRYKTWFGIEAGVEVSLRSLDKALFKDIEVLSE